MTHLVAVFGQFLDHDMSLSPEEEACPCCEEGKDISENSKNCFPIELPVVDQLAKGVPCLPFTRSVVFCEKTSVGNKHEQVNALTGKFNGFQISHSKKELKYETLVCDIFKIFALSLP